MNQPPVTRSSRQSPAPRTGTDDQKINDIIAHLENKWRLGVTVRDGTWSPSRQSRTDPGKSVNSLVKFLYWKGKPVLDSRLAEFHENAGRKQPKERLAYLQQPLESAKSTVVGASPGPGSVTPKQNRFAPVSSSPRYNLRSIDPPIPGPSFQGFGKNSEVGRATVRSPLHTIQPYTSKANDHAAISPPQSPSADARERRQRNPVSQVNRKRSSEEFEDRGGSKASRCSNGKRKSPSFAKPDPPAASREAHSSRSSSRTGGLTRSSTISSMSTEISRVDSVFSLGQNQYRDTRSANTSFTTEATVSQSGKPFHSSGTVSSWDEDFQENVFHRVRQQEEIANPTQASPRIEDLEIDTASQVNISPAKCENLFVPDINEELESLQFKYRWDYVRVAEATNSKPEDLVQNRSANADDYDTFWSCLMEHESFRSRPAAVPRSSPKAWKAPNFENVKLKASLSFNTSNVGPLSKLHMQPLRTETSCRFQRAFGGDRFLYIEVPSFHLMPSHISDQQRYLPDRFVEWLETPKRFLGRVWKAFFVDPIQPRKRQNETELRGYQVILFALHGCDLEGKRQRVSSRAPRQAMDIYDLLNWFMPLEEPNSSQAFPKAFARIALGLTTTNPGLSFMPSQVRYVEDIVADDAPEDDEYNDAALTWPIDTTNKKRVMNDGCARISVGAAQELWKSVGRGGPLPSTFQGRIGGAKGMWILSASQDTRDPEHKDVWIEINNSQLKFKPHQDDYDHNKYDPHRLTFDLHSITDQASSSKIYLSFFPILHDRGVPEESLMNLFGQYLDQERSKLFEATESPVCLRKWVNEQNSVREEKNREDGIPDQGAMPRSIEEKLVLLLESGFDPSNPYVAAAAEKLVSASLQELRMNVRIPLPRCTYIKGVADPLGVLKPGEVHVYFSQSLTDDVSGESTTFLDNRPVLVARNPALRRSDIQKVKARFRLELAHLRDVVVFPSVGKYPLAGKLQGGDYDGDTFWVCWEPDLAEPFKNAPAPDQDPNPEDYGITVDKRRLNELLGVKGSSSAQRPSTQQFLRASFEYRCKSSLLGQATKLHERISYAENCIESRKINALADLHDLLVDSAKNGYSFDQEAFDKFKRHLGIRGQGVPPAYEQARNLVKLKKSKYQNVSDIPYKRDNITDKIFFEAMEPYMKETLKTVKKHFREMQVDVDEDLLVPCKDVEGQAKEDLEVQEELKELAKKMRDLKSQWATFFGPDDDKKKPEDLRRAYDDCFNAFTAIEPTNKSHLLIKHWTHRIVPGMPITWELLKASVLYKQYHKKSLTFVFAVAGKWLCQIKASKGGNARLVVQPMWANMKPRRIKKAIREGKQQRADGDGDEAELSEVDVDGTIE
ncbi:RNA dependent RNA polymerase-domain-containing protein [Phyllosticta capitalensis]|uniref:RNA-dependent RNA polymerase n=1 Tax=Phyllosticta capitalensis TaxID=121624 RepID=A0ABR1YMH2_9PEZI